MMNHNKRNHAYRSWVAVWPLAVLFISIFCLAGGASAGEGKWSISLSPVVTPFLSGRAGSGADAPKYSDAFDTGYGIALEVERQLSAQMAIRGGIGIERYSGNSFQGFSFGDLDIVPIYVGGKYRFSVNPAVMLYLGADLGAAHLSSVDISSGNLSSRYWASSWVFLFDAGMGVEYNSRGPWSASLQTDLRYLGKPDSALGKPSDAGSSWSLPIRFVVRYSF